jgi:predicted metal-dependent hydrolase
MHKNENIVEYRGIGTVRYVKNRRARNISIRVSELGEIRITVPAYVSRRRAEQFLMAKKEWIISKVALLREESSGATFVREGAEVLIRRKPVKVALKRGEQGAEEALWRILLEEARNYLPDRVEALSVLHGFEYTGIRIRKMKSRWGSCTHKKSINLNSWLMMLPDHLSDYVILHELVHTRHPNHGPEFWSALDIVTGGKSKVLRKELRARKIMLIYPENQLGSEGDRLESPRRSDIQVK